MSARREAKRGVFGQEAFVRGQPGECELLMGVIQGELELPPAASVARLRGFGGEPQTDLPQQFASSQAEAVTPADPHECFDRRALELGRGATNEIAAAFERAV